MTRQAWIEVGYVLMTPAAMFTAWALFRGTGAVFRSAVVKPSAPDDVDAGDPSPASAAASSSAAAPPVSTDWADTWKYFEERAANVKASMIQVVTWVIGLAGALIAFVTVELMSREPSVRGPGALILLCVGGVALCVFADAVIWDHVAHMQRNWDRADLALHRRWGMAQVLHERPPAGALKLVWISQKLRFATGALASAFLLAAFAAALIGAEGWPKPPSQ